MILLDISVSVTYLYHSGFAVDIENSLLIFDYYPDTCGMEKRSMASGIMVPEEIKDKKIMVFASHKHTDHFNPIILSWKDLIPDITYFLSSDIPRKHHVDKTHILKPNETFEEPGFRIRTLKSTDAGVAFLVNFNGLSIYHAGDLNWWHWKEESKAWNNNMAARFKKEIGLLHDIPIDIAFLTCDPRLDDAALLGLEYFLSNVKVKHVFPMHFGDDFRIMEAFTQLMRRFVPHSKGYPISHRGEGFSLTLG